MFETYMDSCGHGENYGSHSLSPLGAYSLVEGTNQILVQSIKEGRQHLLLMNNQRSCIFRGEILSWCLKQEEKHMGRPKGRKGWCKELCKNTRRQYC